MSYTYDDCIFHPGHIFFSADEVSASTLPSPRPLPGARATQLVAVTQRSGAGTALGRRRLLPPSFLALSHLCR